MKYCSSYGKKGLDEAKFCGKCGEKLVERKKDEEITSIKQKEYATFFDRFLAFAIDYSIMAILMFVIVFVTGWTWSDEGMTPTIIEWLFLITYNVFFLSTWSKTPGKALFNLVVLDEEGRHLTSGVALKRQLLQILSTFLFGIGYWNMGSDNKKQTFHDKKAQTVVIREGPTPAWVVILSLICVGFVIWIYSLAYA